MANARKDDKAEPQAFILKHFSTSHMSDAKWVKVFLLLADSQIRMVRCKCINDNRIFNARVPKTEQIHPTFLADDAIGGSPLGYAYIEWLELPYHTGSLPSRYHNDRSAIDQFITLLRSKGQFEIALAEGGARIYGYS